MQATSADERRPPRRTRHRNPRGSGERLRSELIEAASRLLETLPGEDALSLRAVAREAGVSAPSIYPHFANKGELMVAVLAVRFTELARVLDDAAEGIEDPRAELRARCLAYCREGEDHPGHYRVMFAAVPTTIPAPDILPGPPIVDTLAALVARTTHSSDRHARRTALLIWCGLHGIVTLRQSKPAVPWPGTVELVDDLLDAHLR